MLYEHVANGEPLRIRRSKHPRVVEDAEEDQEPVYRLINLLGPVQKEEIKKEETKKEEIKKEEIKK